MNLLLLSAFRIMETWPMGIDGTGFFIPSLAQAHLAACIKNKNISVKIIDGYFSKIKIKNLKRIIKKTDIVAITFHSPYMALNVEMNIKIIKKIKPDIKIILGGHHATFYYKRWLEKDADFVVLHEGEETFSELLNNLETPEKVKGIAYKIKENKVILNENRKLNYSLDNFPIPKYEALNHSIYSLPFPGKGFSGTIEFSRGCSNQCSFCIVHKMWKRTQRTKSAERILEELKILYSLNVRKLLIADDNFGDNVLETKKTLKLILKSKMKFSFMAFMRVDTALKNPDMIQLAANAGLKYVLIGYESFSQDMINKFNKTINKELTVKDYEKCYKIFNSNNIFVLGFFINCYFNDKNISVGYNVFNVCDRPVINRFDPLVDTDSCIFKNNGIKVKDMFYHFQNMISFPEQGKVYFKSFIKNIAMLFSFKIFYNILFGNEVSRKTFIHIYKIIFFNIINFNMSKIKDFFIFKDPFLSLDEKQNIIVKKYTCSKNIEHILSNNNKIIGKKLFN